MKLYVSKLVLFLNGFSICALCIQPSQALGSGDIEQTMSWYYPKTDLLQYSHSCPIDVKYKIFIDIYSYCFQDFLCFFVCQRGVVLCQQMLSELVSYCCIFPLGSLVAFLAVCLVFAFLRY